MRGPLALALLWLGCAGTPAFGLTGQPSSTAPEPVAAPEPPDYWTGPINGPVPANITGGTVIRAPELAAMLKQGGVVLVDVSNAPRRPDNLAPGAPWLPLPHQVIPGSLWIAGAGLGTIEPSVETAFHDRLAAATQRDLSHPLVIYCHERCWLSWNAARRAIRYGYRRVYWFPDGIEGWRTAGFPLAVAQPEMITRTTP
jgi:PQQ-dependent catabolism-associated CXXCW motif protein